MADLSADGQGTRRCDAVADLQRKQVRPTMRRYISTMAERFAPGNFVISGDRIGVTRSIRDKMDDNPNVLVTWLDDQSSDWIRSEYLYLHA